MIRYWCDSIPSMDGDKCTVTVVEYNTEETGAGPFSEGDSTGRTFTSAYDIVKESLADVKNRLEIKRDDADDIRETASGKQTEINTWLTNNNL